jgi:hypothetical protein
MPGCRASTGTDAGALDRALRLISAHGILNRATMVTPGGTWACLEQHRELSRIFDDAMTGKAFGQIA